MRRISLFLVVVLALVAQRSSAIAGSGTLAVTPGSGASLRVGTDGSANLFGNGAICDGAACALLASVNAAGTPGTNGLAIQGLTGGVPVPISAASLPLPAGASTAAGLTTINTTLGSPFQAGASIGNTAFIANAGTNLNTSLLAMETGGNLATTATNTGTIAGAVTSSVMQENVKQVNGVTTLAGAGATGTGSQRETVAQDTTTIAGSAPGTAGSASTNVVTAQGIASMTPFLVNPGTAANWGVLAQASTTSGQSGQLGLGAVTTAAPTYTTAQSDPLSLDTSGNLRVNCTTGCSSSGGSSLADEGAFSQGTTSFTVAGGLFSTSVTNLTTGQAGAVRLTNDRKMMTDQPNSEVAIGGATAAVDALQAGGVYNSAAPTLTTGQGAALQLTAAGSLHATIDNSNANGSAVSASSSPVVIASDQAAVATKVASGQIASGALASGSIASGALAAGSISSGAAVSGSFVAGSIADLAHGQGVMAASVPVTIASDQTAVAVKAASGALASGSIASGALASGSIASGALAAGSISSGAAVSGAFVAGSISDLAHGQGTMSASVPVALASNQTVADPCTFQAKIKVAFSTTSGSTQLVALSGSTKIYVCAVHFISTAADSISFTEGTGTACATGATAVSGSTTAASGMDFPANGGMTEGGGGGSVMSTSVGGDELCLLQSGTTKIAGNLMVVQQ